MFAFYLGNPLLQVELILVKSCGTCSALVGVESYDVGVRSVASLQVSRCANSTPASSSSSCQMAVPLGFPLVYVGRKDING